MAKTTTEGLQALKAALKEGRPANAYLFHGTEDYLRRYYLAELEKRLIPAGREEFNLHRLEGRALTAVYLTECVEAMPVMAERTLIEVVDWDLFKLPEEQREGLIALLKDLPDYCCLVFLYEHLEYKPNRTYKKLCAALEVVQVVEFGEQSQAELLKWMAKRLRAAGHTIDAPTGEYLLFLCGTRMSALIPELEKISAFASGERITREDIDAVVEPLLETKVFSLTDAIAKGDFDRAASELGTLLAMQEEPFMLLALLGKELRRLYTARIAIESGRGQSWLMEQWGMRSDYPARLLLDNARRVSTAWCQRGILRCYELDVRMKSVSGVDAEGELISLLMDLGGER